MSGARVSEDERLEVLEGLRRLADELSLDAHGALQLLASIVELMLERGWAARDVQDALLHLAGAAAVNDGQSADAFVARAKELHDNLVRGIPAAFGPSH